ncbi:hypothetical protein [Agilicoccus flavus]|uniref:hypothetical protein n=1 Tax=Agilicoccus flavus TaxID=2775968 RepID=UPI001CF64FDC|nr:hypothetical protein [Agilicoccus flavus]
MLTRRSPWTDILRVCVALAVVSLVFNVTFPAEMSGHWQVYAFLRKSVSTVLSSGTAWAAVAVYAGWRVRRPIASIVAGAVAAEMTLFVHYALGMALRIYPDEMFTSNVDWFVAGVVLCGPLGLVGCWAALRDLAGLLARLVVPAGAAVEPFSTRKFVALWPEIPWPERWSDAASGPLLLALAAAGAVVVVRWGRPGVAHLDARPARDAA